MSLLAVIQPVVVTGNVSFIITYGTFGLAFPGRGDAFFF